MNKYKGPTAGSWWVDTKAKGGWIEGGRWGGVGQGKVVVGKWRQQYSNINKNILKFFKKTKRKERVILSKRNTNKKKDIFW